MNTIRLFSDDIQIAKALIRRNESVTRQYFYKQCYPLFKSIFDNYYTDCTSVIEFINEIYILVLSPSSNTGKCQLENFRGESSLISWLKTASLFYCYKKYERKQKMPIVDSLPNPNDEKYDDCDRLLDLGGSTILDVNNLNHDDVESILNSMPNKRYSNLIRLRYLEQKSNEETAEALGISMDNYYNVHNRAKTQYELACRKEDYYG